MRAYNLLKLVERYGSDLFLIKSTTGAYNPSTGSATSTTKSYIFNGYMYDVQEGIVLDEVRRGTRNCVIPPLNLGAVPDDGDQISGLSSASPDTLAIGVVNDASGSYVLSGDVSGSNATVTLNVGDTVNFTVNASGHPFYINTTNTTGTGSQVSTPPATGQGSVYGVVSWTPNTSGTYYYNCQYHSSMNGIIQVNAVSGSNVSGLGDTVSINRVRTMYSGGVVVCYLCEVSE